MAKLAYVDAKRGTVWRDDPEQYSWELTELICKIEAALEERLGERSVGVDL